MKQPLSPDYDAIVAGSGPGGASVARTLAQRGWRVLILEQGSGAPLKGTLGQMARFGAVPGRSAFVHRDASLLVQGVNVGGSSSLNFATASDPPAAMFAAHGIDLVPEVRTLRAELPIGPLPDHLLGPMASRIMAGARSLGLEWHKLDKMIRPQICRSGCWRCAYGCPFGAKWSARDFVEQACAAGATLLSEATVERALLEDGKAIGVVYRHQGERHSARASTVVLAGGGIGSPRLLHASGLGPRESAFFSDPVVAVMGTVDGLDGGAEVPMAAGMRLDVQGISLADLTLPRPMYQGFTAQVGRLDRLSAHARTLSIMVKIRDDIGGSVGPRWADKTLTPADRNKLDEGVGLARQVLAACGASHVFQSWHFAAHPGGSVRIGAGVDHNLRAAADGLYVCDASVIPQAWGLPPTLTLLALGQRLGTHLADSA
ncbi:GMC family oxidoreductase N-terminal domain-containing protein [Massilia sp. CF038]|uniref:GMC family oxidoreductase N-terminal domain-containing protein n=1 Tax=Massilia sp. CF038 TaxID=1881045 RepID=UPI000922EE8E|nr:GMC family oxidoreductase N-terminal domain-containing protein [Massilia sp. CF038]SHG55757.1 GMC oxidoreductase [Massilia sp. CF038]